MARTVADLALLLEVMAGVDKGDPSATPAPLRRPGNEEPRRFRIGYFEDDGRTPVTSETRAAVRLAAEALRKVGFGVAPYRPEGLESARRLWEIFFCRGTAMALEPVLRGREWELPILKEFRELRGQLSPLTAEAFLQAWVERDALVVQLLAQMESCALLLCPVCAVPAFGHGERAWNIEGKPARYLDATSYTQWFNLLGFPAAVVPVTRSPEGLPIGVQIVGRPYEDEAVLAVAAWVEREGGGWQEPRLGRTGEE